MSYFACLGVKVPPLATTLTGVSGRTSVEFVTGSKVMINYARDHAIKEALDYIALWQTGMFARGHMAEAFKAQQEKRGPRYPDLAKVRKRL